MSRDFFLLNRCYQVAKLCSGEEVAFVLPPAAARHKLPPKLSEFYALLDRIVSLAISETRGTRDDGKNAHASDQPPVQLSLSQRRDLEEFERLVVALRFSEDPAVKQPAVSLIRAIFADAAYFSGLKPLPQYTDAFAYELLFPSWLNLLKACMLPRAGDGRPRLEGECQGALFEFLAKTSVLAENDEQLLIGFMTFLASRFDAPHCAELLQRLVDLVGLDGATTVAALDSIDLACKDARELRSRLAEFVIVKFSLVQWANTSEFTIAYTRPARRAIPNRIAARLQELEAHQNWPDYFELAGPLRHLIESPHALSPEFVALLDREPQRLGSLLSVLTWKRATDHIDVLSNEGQEFVAVLARLQPELTTSEFARLKYFADNMAHRLTGFDEATLNYFRRLLIDDANGRKLLLASCGDTARREALADQLLARAAKSDDSQRFLSLLACVCVVSPHATVVEAKATLQALQAVVANRSMGNKELSDLIDDLQLNYQQAIDYLASPMLAVSGKSPRLAALYLTLNEVSQKLASSGTVDNFSVVRAKYSKLTNMEFD